MNPPSFSIQDAADLYSIERWGGGYFGINESGHVVVHPKRNSETIDLMEVVAQARTHNLAFPLVVRFHDLLRDRVETINKAFAGAIANGAEIGIRRPISASGLWRKREKKDKEPDDLSTHMTGWMSAESNPQLTKELLQEELKNKLEQNHLLK
jgi:hypothetical protein